MDPSLASLWAPCGGSESRYPRSRRRLPPRAGLQAPRGCRAHLQVGQFSWQCPGSAGTGPRGHLGWRGGESPGGSCAADARGGLSARPSEARETRPEAAAHSTTKCVSWPCSGPGSQPGDSTCTWLTRQLGSVPLRHVPGGGAAALAPLTRAGGSGLRSWASTHSVPPPVSWRGTGQDEIH